MSRPLSLEDNQALLLLLSLQAFSPRSYKEQELLEELLEALERLSPFSPFRSSREARERLLS
jgi:hypothetical protein